MKARVIRIIKILVSVLLMYLLFKNIKIDDFQNALINLNYEVVLVAIGVYLVSVVINAIKWHILLPDTSLGFLLFMTFRSQLYSTILPGQLFGEASKLTHWKEQNKEVMSVTASILFDRITGMIGQVILVILGLSFSDVGRSIANTNVFIMLGIVFIGIILVSGQKHVSSIIKKIIGQIKQRQRSIGTKLEELYLSWEMFSVDKVILLKSILWGVINQLAGIIMVWYISMKLGIDIGLVDLCWILPVLAFVLLLPISFAGVGLRDASLSSMLAIFGVSSGESIIVSSLLLLGQIVASFIGGVLVLCSNAMNKTEIREHD